MKTKNEIDGWTPRRRTVAGVKIFCAPACGRGCTQKMHDDALAEGRRIAKILGPGWTVTMHENLGWFHTVWSPCKRFQVDRNYGKAWYSAMLGEAGSVCGRWAAHARTPQAAVRKVVKAAQAALLNIVLLTNGLSDVCKKLK